MNKNGAAAYNVLKSMWQPFMYRFIGFMLFFIAIGMLLMLLIESKIVGIILIGLFLLLGFNCHCRWW